MVGMCVIDVRRNAGVGGGGPMLSRDCVCWSNTEKGMGGTALGVGGGGPTLSRGRTGCAFSW